MAKATGGLKVKKKIWVPVLAPKIFNEAQIGEMYLESPELAVGRQIKVSLMTITGEPQKQNTHVIFNITGVSGSKLVTESAGFAIATAATKKMVRRGKDKINLSFTAKTKDGKTVRIKPVLVTRGKPGGAVLTDLSNLAKARVIKAAATYTFEELLKEIVQRKFQRNLQDSLRKTYPIQICEIKSLTLVKEAKTFTTAKAPAEAQA